MRARHPMVARIAVLSLMGLALFMCIMQGNWLLAPRGLQWVSSRVYRIAFLATFSLYPVAAPFLKKPGELLPWPYFAVVSMATPFVWYGAWRALKALAARVPRSNVGESPRQHRLTRRAFLAVATLPVGLGAYAVFVEPERVSVRAYTAEIKDLPESSAGLKLVHVSDTHYGPYITLRYLERVVRLINDLDGDLVILTGDYVQRTARAIEPGVSVFAGIRARLGAVAVLGNHDHELGAQAVGEAFERIDVPLVDNSRLFLSEAGLTERAVPGGCLCVAGVGDLTKDSFEPNRALGGVPQTMPRILLSHNPDAAELLPAEMRVDLICAGHTHGGQVRLPWIGTPILPIGYGGKYAGGWCDGPQCPVVVSRGIGMILPVRFGVPPEIGVITLQRARTGM